MCRVPEQVDFARGELDQLDADSEGYQVLIAQVSERKSLSSGEALKPRFLVAAQDIVSAEDGLQVRRRVSQTR
eukprot:1286729-Amphidinium_carterae.1